MNITDIAIIVIGVMTIVADILVIIALMKEVSLWLITFREKRRLKT